MAEQTPDSSTLPKTVQSMLTAEGSILTQKEKEILAQGYQMLLNPELLSWGLTFARVMGVPFEDVYSIFRTMNKEVAHIYQTEAERKWRETDPRRK